MNYFHRLMRRAALLQNDVQLPGVLEDPFAREEAWSLDEPTSSPQEANSVAPSAAPAVAHGQEPEVTAKTASECPKRHSLSPAQQLASAVTSTQPPISPDPQSIVAETLESLTKSGATAEHSAELAQADAFMAGLEIPLISPLVSSANAIDCSVEPEMTVGNEPLDSRSSLLKGMCSAGRETIAGNETRVDLSSPWPATPQTVSQPYPGENCRQQVLDTNYFQRLVRRALLQNDAQLARLMDDPFATEDVWPLDDPTRSPVTTSSVIPPTVLPHVEPASVISADPLSASPARQVPVTARTTGGTNAPVLGRTPTPSAVPPPTQRLASDPAVVRSPQPTPHVPTIAESLQPSVRPGTVTEVTEEKPLANEFMTEWDMPMSAVSPLTVSPVLTPTGARSCFVPEATARNKTDATRPPLRATVPQTVYPPQPSARQPMAPRPARRQPMDSMGEAAPPTSGQPASKASNPVPLVVSPAQPQVLIVKSATLPGSGARLGSGAPYFGLGQL